MGAPRPGEWLVGHRESGQTFQQYLGVRPPALGVTRNTIYLVPLGTHTPEQGSIERETAEFLALFYGMPTRWLNPIAADAIPESARRTNPDTQQLQFNSIYILNEVLRGRVPNDAATLLALTATDLWPGEGWNFVFGQGSLGQPTGVWSMHRFGDPADDTERPLVLMRMLKTASHEAGHLFGMPHCTAYQCGMNGSNSLSETDRHPLAFCPECEAKIWLIGGMDRRQRYRELAAFARRHGLADAEKLWTASADALPPR